MTEANGWSSMYKLQDTASLDAGGCHTGKDRGGDEAPSDCHTPSQCVEPTLRVCAGSHTLSVCLCVCVCVCERLGTLQDSTVSHDEGQTDLKGQRRGSNTETKTARKSTRVNYSH